MKIFVQQVVAFLVLFFQTAAQPSVFINPLKGDIKLSGSFCEIRPDHFHSGIDLKTGGREGVPVLAVADGYIYRVKVSSSGYGKALYILHADQKLTVYAHLLEFRGSIADTVKSLQYFTKSFEQEYFPDSAVFKVKQGDVIALSGNSGGSEGPHLHFEIRDQRLEEPLNPLTNGWKADDTVEPVITGVSVYSYRNGIYSFLEEKALSGTGKDTMVVNTDTVALAVSCYDEMNDENPSKLGIYKALIIAGGDTVYAYSNERMNFDQTRSVNAHIDARLKSERKKIYQRFFTLPGNEMKTFETAGSGVIPLKDSAIARILLYDHNDNINEQTLVLIRGTPEREQHSDLVFYFPNSQYTLQKSDMRINFRDSAFYQTEPGIQFLRERAGDKSRFLKMVPAGLPLRRPALIAFKLPHKWKGLEEKVLVAVADNKGKVLRSAGGVHKKGWVETTIRSFNNYTIAIDTISPRIEVGGVFKNHIEKEYFQLRVTDELSGIGKYSCTVNDLWHLFEYDAKSGSLFAEISSLPSQFILEAYVQDNKKNSYLLKEKIDLGNYPSR